MATTVEVNENSSSRQQIAFRENPNIHLLTSRFNTVTWRENEEYRQRMGITGCIYGAPLQVTHKINLMSSAYVIEMNNSINKIEGIGLFVNRNVLDKNYRIYSDMDYNRYIYKGSKHLIADKITDEYSKRVISVLEQLLFKGSRHCKRAQGITALPDWITHNKFGFDFVPCLNEIFKKYA